MVTTRSGRRSSTGKNGRSSLKTFTTDSETDEISSDREILEAPVVCRVSSTDTEIANVAFDQQIDENYTENDNASDAGNESAVLDDSFVDHKLAINEVEDDDFPVEISSKCLSSNEAPQTGREQSGFEKIQQCLIEKEKIKQEKSARRVKRKKMQNGGLNVKLRKSEFNVIPLDGNYKSPIEPGNNFKTELLLSRTSHLRFRNGANQFSHRSKWGQSL